MTIIIIYLRQLILYKLYDILFEDTWLSAQDLVVARFKGPHRDVISAKLTLCNCNIQKNLVSHEQMHKVRSENDFWYKCPISNCQSTFQYQCLLEPHMRIHNNELNECQYCPYLYVNPPDYKDHLNKHFRIKLGFPRA